MGGVAVEQVGGELMWAERDGEDGAGVGGEREVATGGGIEEVEVRVEVSGGDEREAGGERGPGGVMASELPALDGFEGVGASQLKASRVGAEADGLGVWSGLEQRWLIGIVERDRGGVGGQVGLFERGATKRAVSSK